MTSCGDCKYCLFNISMINDWMLFYDSTVIAFLLQMELYFRMIPNYNPFPFQLRNNSLILILYNRKVTEVCVNS